MVARGDSIWTPSPERISSTNWSRFAASAVGSYGAPPATAADPDALHRWSLDAPGPFWSAIWDAGGLGPHRGGLGDLSGGVAAAPSFFPDARLNVAGVLLGAPTDREAFVARGEDGSRRALTRRQLRDAVLTAAGALVRDGVRPGDRVVAVVPFSVESVVIGLATAAIGATFASASPDFGEDALVDRFGQLDPVVLVATGQHAYGGKRHDTVGKSTALADRLGVRRGVMIDAATPPGGGVWIEWDTWLGAATPCAELAPYPYDQPWYVLFSSGTTGKPKAIVHRTGGVLLKHLSEHLLHSDIRHGDVVFQYTTTGWMMWNWAVSALAAGATVVSYDGSPFQPAPTALWDVIDAERVTMFGTSAKYLDECAKAGVEPRATHRLDSLRTISSTGSPLSTDRFAWVYAAVAPDAHLASISGGTDLCGCLVAGYPTEPVRAGVIQGPALGVAADVVDDEGVPVVEHQGELVVDRPFPSQPLGFVGDDGSRYRAAYYERFPGRWHQGDRTTRTNDGGFVIHGRSDATLNPGGVRIGTAEIYRTVDRHPAVIESIAVPRTVDDDQVIVLFVRLAEGHVLDDELIADLRNRIRTELSPRHVPAAIGQVQRIPRTKSGKLVEIAVRTIVNGGTVAETGALDDPTALEEFVDHPCLAGIEGDSG